MTAPTLNRSAYPPAIDDLMPRAIELVKALDGELPSRNRLMKDLHIGSEKAKAVLAELSELAERDQRTTDLHTAMVVRGSTVPRPPLHLVPETPVEPAEQVDINGVIASLDDTIARLTAERADDSPGPADAVAEPAEQAAEVAAPVRRPVTWPVLILCLPAFVAIWGGWVEMGRLTGFGMVKLLPGILDGLELNTAITLPIGVETYAAYALFVWLSGRATGSARDFAKWSALASLGLGAAGQVAYHLMAAAGWTSAPWPITAAVACIPVAVLGMGAGLAHLMHRTH
jgi:hypothetical protein